MTEDDIERRLRAAVAVVDPLGDTVLAGLVTRRRRIRRRSRTVGGVLVALIAVVGLVVGLAPSGNSTKVQVVGNLPVHHPSPHSVPERTVPTVHLRTSSFRTVGPVFAYDNWFTSADGATYVIALGSKNIVVDRINTVTGRVTASVPVAGRPSFSPPIFTDDAIWVGTETHIIELDPTSLRTVRSMRVAHGLSALAAAGGRLWAISANRLYVTPLDRLALAPVEPEITAYNVFANQAGTALAVPFGLHGFESLDPDTGRVLAQYPMKNTFVTIAGIVDDTVWLVEGNSGDPSDVVGVRLATGTVVEPNGLGRHNGPEGLSWDGRTLLLGDRRGSWCIDPATGRAEVRIDSPNIVNQVDDGIVGNWFYFSGPRTQLVRARVTGCG